MQSGTSLAAVLLCVTVFHVSAILSWRDETVHKLADWKLCADEECSHPISMARALADYTGPDCRFINIRQGQIVYVYGKLKGRGRNFWQGTVQGDYYGSQSTVLGFFPKSVVQEVQHLVTDLMNLPTVNDRSHLSQVQTENLKTGNGGNSCWVHCHQQRHSVIMLSNTDKILEELSKSGSS